MRSILKHTSFIAKRTLIVFLALTIAGAPFFAYHQQAQAQVVIAGTVELPFSVKQTIENSSQTASNLMQQVKEYGLDTSAKVIATRLLQGLVSDVVNWANTGFHGNPFYVQDDDQFFENLRHEQLVPIVDSLAGIGTQKVASSENLSPEEQKRLQDTVVLGRELAKFVVLQELSPFSERVVSNFADKHGVSVNEFSANFDSGGWDAYMDISTRDQNIPLISYGNITAEIDRRSGKAEARAEAQLDQSGGYISMKECVDKGSVSSSSGSGSGTGSGSAGTATSGNGNLVTTNNQQQTYGPQNKPNAGGSGDDDGGFVREQMDNYSFNALGATVHEPDCNEWRTTNPGDAIGDMINQALGDPMSELQQADELQEVITNAIATLADHYLSKGLNSLASQASAAGNDSNEGFDLQKRYAGLINSPDIGGSGTGVSNWREQPEARVNIEEDLPVIINNIEEETALLAEIIDLNEDRASLLMQLDRCLPGPDIGWEERLRDRYRSRSSKLSEKAMDDEDDLQTYNEQQTVLARGISMIRALSRSPQTNIPIANEIKSIIQSTKSDVSEKQGLRDEYNDKLGMSTLVYNMYVDYIIIKSGITGIYEEMGRANTAIEEAKVVRDEALDTYEKEQEDLMKNVGLINAAGDDLINIQEAAQAAGVPPSSVIKDQINKSNQPGNQAQTTGSTSQSLQVDSVTIDGEVMDIEDVSQNGIAARNAEYAILDEENNNEEVREARAKYQRALHEFEQAELYLNIVTDALAKAQNIYSQESLSIINNSGGGLTATTATSQLNEVDFDDLSSGTPENPGTQERLQQTADEIINRYRALRPEFTSKDQLNRRKAQYDEVQFSHSRIRRLIDRCEQYREDLSTGADVPPSLLESYFIDVGAAGNMGAFYEWAYYGVTSLVDTIASWFTSKDVDIDQPNPLQTYIGWESGLQGEYDGDLFAYTTADLTSSLAVEIGKAVATGGATLPLSVIGTSGSSSAYDKMFARFLGEDPDANTDQPWNYWHFLITADKMKMAYCSAPQHLFYKETRPRLETANACRTAPKEDPYTDTSKSDSPGYKSLECKDGSGNDKLGEQNQLLWTDIFGANALFWNSEVNHFSKSFTCSSWYSSNLGNYMDIGGY